MKAEMPIEERARIVGAIGRTLIHMGGPTTPDQVHGAKLPRKDASGGMSHEKMSAAIKGTCIEFGATLSGTETIGIRRENRPCATCPIFNEAIFRCRAGL